MATATSRLVPPAPIATAKVASVPHSALAAAVTGIFGNEAVAKDAGATDSSP